jgi:hypothetical protein
MWHYPMILKFSSGKQFMDRQDFIKRTGTLLVPASSYREFSRDPTTLVAVTEIAPTNPPVYQLKSGNLL